MLDLNYKDKHAMGIAQVVFAVVAFIVATLYSPFMADAGMLRGWVIKEPLYLVFVVYLGVVVYRGIQNMRKRA